jgi:hypothetical protein
MAYWSSPLVVDGTIVDLSHLEPFTFSILPADFIFPVNIHVKFHHHCFSEALTARTSQIVLRPPHGDIHQHRCFSAERYELSKLLAPLIKAFERKAITRSSNGNLVRIELPKGRSYAIFFTLRKTTDRQCEMTVVSAFCPDNPKTIANSGSMKFNLAVCKTLRNQPLKMPK